MSKIKLICNNFQGIRTKSANFSSFGISAYDMQNVELYNTGVNSGVGIKTTKGNINISSNLIPEGEKIINIFESVQRGISRFFVHTVSNNEGKVYLLDMTNSTLTLKIEGLSVTDESFGVDFAQGVSDLFIFSNGVDWLHTIEIGAQTEVKILEIYDRENNPIKGRILGVYDGRLWTNVGKRLHWCVQADITDWATSDINIATSAGFIDFVKDITAIKPYLSSLAVFFRDSSIIITGQYPYSTTEDSPGGCISPKALVFHGTDLYFFDYFKKGIFSFQQVVLGNKTLGQNIAIEVQNELEKIDATKLNEIQALSVIMKNRNEIWFYIPTTDENRSTILIYDSIHGEWTKRISNKINCLCMFKGELYSAGKKIYKELQGKTFDGEFIQSHYKTSPYDGGSDTTIKALYYEPKLTLGEADTNNFRIKYKKNYDYFKNYKENEIKSKYKNFMIWGQSYWEENSWSVENPTATVRLPRISYFKVLEIEIYNKNENEDFNIKGLEFSEVEIYQA